MATIAWIFIIIYFGGFLIGLYRANENTSKRSEGGSYNVRKYYRDEKSYQEHYLNKRRYLSNVSKPGNKFTTKVVGVTFDGRQNTIRKLHVGEALNLVREPSNPHDPNALKVLRISGEQVGYIDRQLAKSLSAKLRSTNQYTVRVLKIIGDPSRGQSLGVVIQLSPT